MNYWTLYMSVLWLISTLPALAQISDSTLSLSLISSYSVSNGLPSNNVYHLMQDQSGLIWASTDRGVSVFDGEEFTNLGTEEGLCDYEILSSRQDLDGKIWFSTFNGKICYWNHNKFESVPISSKQQMAGPIESYLFIDDKIFIIPDRGKGIMVNSDSTYAINLAEGSYRTLLLDRFNKSNDLFYVLINDEIADQIEISTPDKTSYLNGQYSFLTDYDKSLELSLFKIENETIFFEKFDLGTHKITNRYPLDQLKGASPISVYQTEDLLLVGTQNGLYTYQYDRLQEKLYLTDHLFESLSVSSILEIHDGTFWISTLEEGIKQLGSTQFKSKLHDRPVFRIVESEGRIFTCEQGMISEVFQNDSISQINCHFSREKITDVAITITGELLVGSGLGLFKIQNSDIYSFHIGGGIKDIILSNGRAYIGAYNGTIWLSDTQIESGINQSKRVSRLRTNAIAIQDQKLILGNTRGVWSIDLNSGAQNQIFQKIDSRINRLFSLNQDIWVATADDGIWKVSDKTYQHFLPGKTIFSLDVVNEQRFWAVTNSNIVFFNKGETISYSFEELDIQGKVEDVHESYGHLYVGSSSGLYKIPLNSINSLKTKVQPRFVFTKALVNGKEFNHSMNVDFAYDQNSFEFNYRAIHFRSQNPVQYHYSMINKTKGKVFSTETKSRKLSFYDLEPGSYQFKIFAESQGISSEEASISFTIIKPFYATWWFHTLILCLVSFSIIFFVQKRLAFMKQEQNRLKEIHNYEQKALRAKMNPHFLFNVLNSIQHFFLNENNLEGHKYLKRFAELVRLVLNNTEKTFTTLAEEINYLQRYVELEQLRSAIKFSFRISIAPEIDPELYQVPTMTIQPFIENSIWHAFNDKSKDPEILIAISENQEFLIIEISDNGVGFDPNFINKTEDINKPKGLNIVSERIGTLQKYINKNTSLEITSSPGKGTFVRINIPKKND